MFDVCAGTQVIGDPKIKIMSDSESKIVTLSDSVRSKVCQFNASVIKAVDKNTIQMKMTNQYPDLSKKIQVLEEKINVAKSKIKENGISNLGT